jgi:hypothetical protein
MVNPLEIKVLKASLIAKDFDKDTWLECEVRW